MTLEEANKQAQKYNTENHKAFTIGVLRFMGTMAGVPVTIGIFRVKEGDPHRHFTDIDDAADYGEKIVQKIVSKT